MNDRFKRKVAAAAALCVVSCNSLAQTAPRTDAEQRRFHDVYKELVNINTSNSVGDNTAAVTAMKQYLVGDGFTEAEVQIFEPFPRKGNLVVRLEGDGTQRPMLLLAHVDVVEAKREDWKTDPFILKEDDGYFTARGSLDNKAMAAAFVSIIGQLKREGFQSRRDLILALTADEEMSAVPSNGAWWLLRNHPELITADFGINEGGSAQLRRGKPTIQRVQIAEKMNTSYKLEITDVGGHSSLPTDGNPIYPLAAALGRIGEYRFPVKLAEVTRAYFEKSARFETDQLKEDMLAVASGDPSTAALDRLSSVPLYNAILRTTCVATRLNAGHANNALPQSASATVNCRILPQDDPDAVDATLRQLLGNDRIQMTNLIRPMPSPPSPLRPDIMNAVNALTEKMWPGVTVVPFMSTGGTDSRFMRNAGIPMYGVSGIFYEPSDARMHGLDERVPQKSLYEGREFLYQLIKQLAASRKE
ncbi:MAG: M20/M25/M40 family metallo-hydrolase [Burkholderiales bacterium]